MRTRGCVRSYLLVHDAGLLTAVTRIFVHAVSTHLRCVARREFVRAEGACIEAGAVCVP